MLRQEMAKVDLPTLDTAQAAATHDRILDAAERLFAEHGVAGTSVRAITEQAQVNVAAVNYHFGTKENLVRAVIARRLSGLEAARAAALDGVERRADREGRAPTVRELVEALIAPVFAQALSEDAGWPHFIRFVSRLAWEPGVEELAPPESSMRLFERFDAALRRAAPALGADDGKRLWRLAFMRGAMQHTLLMITALRAGRAPKGMPLAEAAAATDLDTIRQELTAFVAAGLSTA
jgi:AcrR family transcriptional regulator